jgi:hypothetical protein
MKKLIVMVANNDADVMTKATTEAGFLRVAKKLVAENISTGLQRVKIRVEDQHKTGDPVIFEEVRDLIC